MEGVSGLKEARIKLLTWDNGWEGWSKNIVGGVFEEYLPFCVSSGLLSSLDGWDKAPKGNISLNR